MVQAFDPEAGWSARQRENVMKPIPGEGAMGAYV